MEGEVVKALSQHTKQSETFLFASKKHGHIIKKVCHEHMTFKRVVEAMKAIDRSLHPAVLKIDMRRQVIYMSYQPLTTPLEDKHRTAAELLKQLHDATRRYKVVSDPGTGEVYPFWKEYLKKHVPAWLDQLDAEDDIRDVSNQLIKQLPASGAHPVAYIHGQMSSNHIGERKGSPVFLHFDRAIWGDPYWDIAGYIVEEEINPEWFYQCYDVEDKTRIKHYIWLYTLQKAADLYRENRTDGTNYVKLLNYLKN